jgi:hypothetical protein
VTDPASNENRSTNFSPVEESFCAKIVIVPPMIEVGHQLDTLSFGCCQHFFGFSYRGCERFFADHVLSSPGSFDGYLAMESIWRSYYNDVNVTPFDEVAPVMNNVALILGPHPHRLVTEGGADVSHSGQAEFGNRHNRFSLALTDSPAANDRYLQWPICRTICVSHGCSSLS